MAMQGQLPSGQHPHG